MLAKLVYFISILGFIYFLYLIVNTKGKYIFLDKKVLILSIFLIFIQFINFGLSNNIPLIVVINFILVAIAINLFWFYMHKAKHIIEQNNIQLDYEPIVWPLFIHNILQINKKVNIIELQNYITRIKLIPIFIILVIINFVVATIG